MLFQFSIWTSQPQNVFYLLLFHCGKSVRIWSFFDSYFPAFGLNAKRCFIPLRIQWDCGKIRTRRTPNTDTFHTVFIINVHPCYFEKLGLIKEILVKFIKSLNTSITDLLGGDLVRVKKVVKYHIKPLLQLSYIY